MAPTMVRPHFRGPIDTVMMDTVQQNRSLPSLRAIRRGLRAAGIACAVLTAAPALAQTAADTAARPAAEPAGPEAKAPAKAAPVPAAKADPGPKADPKPKGDSRPKAETKPKTAPKATAGTDAKPPAPAPATPPAAEVAAPPVPAAPKGAVRPTIVKAPPPYMPEVTPIPRVADPEGIPPAPRSDLPPRQETLVAASGAVPSDIAGRSAVALDFAAGSDAVDAAGVAMLQAVAQRLAATPAERLELRAHAAPGPDGETGARRLALARALAVRQHLMALGVPKQRLLVYALGAAAPEGGSDRVELFFRR